MVLETFRKVIDKVINKYGKIEYYEIDEKGNLIKPF